MSLALGHLILAVVAQAVLFECLLTASLLPITSKVHGSLRNWNVSNQSDCKIPNQSPNGVCISIGDCPAYREIRNSSSFNAEAVNFLKNLQCPSLLEPLVCCPRQANAKYQQPFLKFTKAVVEEEYRPKQLTPPHGKEKRPRSLLHTMAANENPTSLWRLCGKQATKRIYGGEIAELDEFPWLALLVYNTNDFGCSAALIDDRHLLTAAHCVQGQGYRQKMGLKSVRLGEFNIHTEPDCIEEYNYINCADAAFDTAVEQIFVNPDYKEDSVNKFHDIAIIRLKHRVAFSRYISPVCLPPEPSKTARFTAGQLFSVAGWGRTDLFSTYFINIASPIKLKLKIPLMAKENCSKIMQKFGIKLGAKQLCAGGIYGKDTCAGDSGGPLMYFDRQHSRWFVYGIVSYGFRQCGLADYPSVYTNVAEYLDWIYNIILP